MEPDFEGVRFGAGVTIGDHCVLDAGARIGDNVRVGSFVHIFGDSVIGPGCSIADHAVVGKPPQLAASSTASRDELAGLVLGAGCIVGSHATIMTGTTFGDGCVVADRALVRERCAIGDRVVVGSGATVENDTSIGSRTRIQTGAYVTAYMTVEEDVFIAPMVVTTNDNYMGRTERRFAERAGATIHRGARVGGGAHILPGIDIGEEAFVAAASVVTRDVPAGCVVMGSPARVVREVPSDQLLDNQ